MTSTTLQPTLSTALLQDERSQSLLTQLALVLAGSLLLTASAKLSIPFLPVPFTMQTFAVLMVGAVLGARMGALTVLVYLAQGMSGLPVFAGPLAGPAYFAGPTAGFLIAFPIAAYLVGALAERGWDRRIASTALAMALGTALILCVGTLWIAKGIGVTAAVQVGLLPFLPGAIFKVALAAACLPAAWRFVGKQR